MSRRACGSAPKMRALAKLAVASLACAVAAVAPAPGAEIKTPPDFAPDSVTGWQLLDDDFIPPPSGPGPIVSDPAHPYVSFYRFPQNPKPAFRVADLSNPILQPWAREHLRKVNERALSGEVVSIPKERCWPVGVPAFLLLPATPVYFLQTPKQVTMVWMQNHQTRRVYMDVPHSAGAAPSWYGESVGHYEDDTLVVDTMGISPRSYIDNYQTPHTDQLHVVERFHMINGGRMLEVNVHVEDPGAFTTPWNAVQRYRRTNTGPMSEVVCAENNDDHFHHGLEPMPQADRPDF
jgi:hypothetical protein